MPLGSDELLGTPGGGFLCAGDSALRLVCFRLVGAHSSAPYQEASVPAHHPPGLLLQRDGPHEDAKEPVAGGRDSGPQALGVETIP
jgi:hypothetical protein